MVKSLPARIPTMDIRACPMDIHALAMDLGTDCSTWGARAGLAVLSHLHSKWLEHGGCSRSFLTRLT